MKTAQHIAIVTGGNRGIGFEICRKLVRRGIRVILTAREQADGQRAASQLIAESLPVEFHQLDVTDSKSVAQLGVFAKNVLRRVDILVNNAGIFIDKDQTAMTVPSETIRKTLETNVLGMWQVSQAIIPLMKAHNYGRVVNLSSGLGQLAFMEDGLYPSYRLSKTGVNALTRMFAGELKGTNVLVNAVCPGWVRTRMGGENAERSVEQGADAPVWLAMLPDGGPTGGLFRDREPIPW